MIDKVFYLCNKQKSCAGSMACGALCNHTTDEAFTKNEPWERKFEKEVKADSDGILKIYMREVEPIDEVKETMNKLFPFGKDEGSESEWWTIITKDSV